jgi:hypothetical protein
LPAGIVAPVNENPNTVVAEVETLKPLASAEPPEAPEILTPSTLN